MGRGIPGTRERGVRSRSNDPGSPLNWNSGTAPFFEQKAPSRLQSLKQFLPTPGPYHPGLCRFTVLSQSEM